MLIHRSRGAEFVLMQLLSDLAAVFSGLGFAYWLRFHSGLIPHAGDWRAMWYLRELPWAVVLWMAALYMTGNYVHHPQVLTFNRARRLFVGSALAIMMLVVKNYFFRDPDLARIMYPMTVATVTTALIAYRAVLQRLIVRFFVGNNLPRARALIVGTGPVALRIAARIRMHPEYAYQLVGFADANDARRGLKIGGVPVLGPHDDLRRILRQNAIHDVFLAASDMPQEDVFRLFLESEMERARVHIVPNLAELMRTTVYYDELISVPLYTIRESPLRGANLVIKRAVDVACSAAGLLILSPVFALVALLVKRSSPGPAIYAQQRLGFDGEEFTLYKFRTMPVGADKQGSHWADTEDPRATRTGNFLRRWNLDELPQLWNVLRGDMSLVGPRPERPAYVDKFREAVPHYMARHKVLTGMTGWAQVHGLRGNTSIPQRLRFDLHYIENWSLWLDIKILLMTFFRPRHLRRRAQRIRAIQQKAATAPAAAPLSPAATGTGRT